MGCRSWKLGQGRVHSEGLVREAEEVGEERVEGQGPVGRYKSFN